MRPREIRGRVAWLTGAALFVLLGTVLLSYQDWILFREATADAMHARSVLDSTEALLSALRDAETGQRGFLLTGDAKYLNPYQDAVKTIPDHLTQLIALLGGRQRQAAWAARLQPLISGKLAELRGTLHVAETQGTSAAIAIVRSDRGKQLMDEIRHQCHDITDVESAELARRRDTFLVSGQRTRMLTTFGSAILFVLIVLAAGTILAADARREQLIDDLQASEKRTAEVRDLLETTLSSIGDAVIATDVEGRVTFINPVAQALTQYTREQAVGRPLSEVFRVVNEGTRQEVESPVNKVLREKAVVGLANHTILVARNGAEIPINDSGAPIRNPQGAVVGVVLVFRDVTKLKQALEALRESEEHLRLSAEAGEIGAWSYDVLKGLFRSSPQLERLYGVDPGKFRGTMDHFFALIHAEDRQRVIDAATQSIEDGSEFEVEYRLAREDGEVRWLLSRGKAIHSDEKTVVAGVTMDISARRRLEEKLRQSQKLESLGVLAGGIAHDFNNLLVGILGNASVLMEQTPPGSPLREVIENLTQASERATHLTRQMLAYSGKGRFVIERLNLSRQVSEILALIDASVPKSVRVELNFEDELPPIEGDAGQIQQLIMNLVINGAEAIGPSGGAVTISTSHREIASDYVRDNLAGDSIPPGSYVVLEVHDDGIGMDTATQARIFDPFFTTKFTGRGLGLAAALGIVRGHRGALTVYSAPGKGTTFTILLPAARTQEAPEAAPSPGADFHGEGTILVIDDEKLVQRTLKTALASYGYTVVIAGGGQEALDELARDGKRISLALLDMTMPGMSGEETLQRLRSLHPDLPVIATSGYNETEALRRFGAGLRGFIQKPYTPRKLAEKIREVIERGSAGAAV